MNDIRPLLIPCLMVLLTACATGTRVTKALMPVAIAISATDGTAPTSEQIQAVHTALLPELEKRAMLLVRDPEIANYLIVVRFTPAPLGGTGGHVSVLGIQPNTMRRGSSQAEQMRAEAAALEREILFFVAATQ